MSNIDKQEQIKTAACYYLNKCGYSVLPIGNDKRPLGSWVEQQKVRIISKDVDSWTCTALGIVTGTISGIVVVDCDSKDDSQWWWNNRPKQIASFTQNEEHTSTTDSGKVN